MIEELQAPETTPMTRDELQSFVVQSLEAAKFGLGEIVEERKDNLEYYENRSSKDIPAGNRSKVQTSDVADNVNWLLDEVMDLLYSVGSPVEFIPNNAMDIQEAKQETKAVTYVLNQENEGFLAVYQWVKDALIQKNGVIKVYWDEKVREEMETYMQASHAEFLQFLQDEDVTVEEQTLYIAGEEQESNELPPIDPALPPQVQQQQLAARLQMFTHDVKLRRKSKIGKICIENVAPENFFVARNHPSLDLSESLFCGQIELKTRGQLITDGFDRKTVMDLPMTSGIMTDEESAVRMEKEGGSFGNSMGGNELAEEVEVLEAYCFCDIYGDGKLRLVQTIIGGGANGELLSYEEVDSIPFIAITPEINSYRFYGTCPADRVKQIQRAKTAITRQILDNLYLSNNPQPVVNVNKLAEEGVEDLSNVDIGAMIRVNEDGAVTYTSAPFVAGQALPILQLFDDMAERRTGVSKMSQGLDPSMLKDQSMYIGAKMMNASMKKVQFLARTFAETGFRWLYLRIHELLSKYEADTKVMEIDGDYAEVNPRSWRKRTSMRVLVGTGNNTNDMKLSGLQQITAIQKDIIAGGGMGTLLNIDNIHNTLADLTEMMGLKDVNRYFQAPNKAPAEPEKPKEPEPAFVLGMADIQAKKEIAQANLQVKAMEIQSNAEIKKQELAQDGMIEQQKIEIRKAEVKNDI